MAIQNSWNNGLTGSKYIRVNHSTTKKNKHIYRVRSSPGTTTYDLSHYTPSQRMKFVQRAVDGYAEKVDFPGPLWNEVPKEIALEINEEE